MNKIHFPSEIQLRPAILPKQNVVFPILDIDNLPGRKGFVVPSSSTVVNKYSKQYIRPVHDVSKKFRLDPTPSLTIHGFSMFRNKPSKKIIPPPEEPDLNPKPVKTICLEGCRYDVVRRIALELNFCEVPENEFWNILWTDTPISLDKALDMRRLQDAHKIFWGPTFQVHKTNHFPGMHEICRKDRLARNLNRMKKVFPEYYTFFPRTWSLPTDVAELLAHFRSTRNPTYICKPDSGCQGKGIFLVRNLKKINPFAKLISQIYIPNPLLIDGYKFDLRIYILVTSCDPLRIYIYNEGIARFATVKYASPSDQNVDIVFMHLTNYSLNKFSQSYMADPEGSKRKLSTIYGYLVERGFNVQKMIADIDDVVIKTVIAAQPTLRHYYRASFPRHERGSACFEILGFDILIDENLKPWLLEVNLSPSFNLDLAVDAEIKENLLRDTLNKIHLGNPNKKSDHSNHRKLRKGVVNLRRPIQFDIIDKAGNEITKSLQLQFYHEQMNQGNFRLVYPNENFHKYAQFLDPTMNLVTMNDLSSATNRREFQFEGYTNDTEEQGSVKYTKSPLSPVNYERVSLSAPMGRTSFDFTPELPPIVVKEPENLKYNSEQHQLELLRNAAEALSVIGGNMDESCTPRLPPLPNLSEVQEDMKTVMKITHERESEREKKKNKKTKFVVGSVDCRSTVVTRRKYDKGSHIIVNLRDGLSPVNFEDYIQEEENFEIPCLPTIDSLERQIYEEQVSSQNCSRPISPGLKVFKDQSVDHVANKIQRRRKQRTGKKVSTKDVCISSMAFLPTLDRLALLRDLEGGHRKHELVMIPKTSVNKSKLVQEWILNGAKVEGVRPKGKQLKIDNNDCGNWDNFAHKTLRRIATALPGSSRRQYRTSSSFQLPADILTREEDERKGLLKERGKTIRQLGIEGKIFEMMRNSGTLNVMEELMYNKIFSEEEFKANKKGVSTLLKPRGQSVFYPPSSD